MNQDRVRKHLLVDIWQFYRAERLYILRVVKEILSHTNNSAHKHQETFLSIFKKLKEKDLKGSLIRQFCSTIGCKYEQSEGDNAQGRIIPSSDNVGTLPLHFRDDLGKAWVHFTLREQVELLHLLHLYFYVEESTTKGSYDSEDVKLLLTVFQNHNFGRKQKFIGVGHTGVVQAADVIAPELADAVGQLESLFMLHLFDLPSLTEVQGGVSEAKSNPLWYPRNNDAGPSTSVSGQSSLKVIGDIDITVSSLGNVQEHSPVMLGWMLAHYLVEGESSLAHYRGLGERAVQLNVLKFLLTCLQNEATVGTSGSLVCSITHSIIYSLISVLTTAFNPEKMGLAEDFHGLVCTLFKHELVAADFWKQGFESGLGMYFASCLSRFPAITRPFVELCSALATAGRDSANEVFSMFSERLTIFAEPVEDVPAHQIELISPGANQNYDTNRWRLIVQARCPHGSWGGCENRTVIIPGGATVSTINICKI